MRLRAEERRVSRALAEIQAPATGQAEERGWRVVREAFADRERLPARARWQPRAALAGLAAAAVAALALTPAGADVREWIADVVAPGEEDARPLLDRLPADGSLLVETQNGAWIVNEDGSRRRLGDYRSVTWSANGIYVGASRGRELFALTRQGEERWVVTAPAGIRSLDWSSDEGVRVAYVAGQDLRVVAGDGTGDSLAVPGVGSAAIAWRPEDLPGAARHEIAFTDGENRVALIDTDSARIHWRSAPFPAPVEKLEWSADGSRLLVGAKGFAVVLDADGEPLVKGPLATGRGPALTPGGERIAILTRAAGGERLTLVDIPGLGSRGRVLYPAAGGPGATGLGEPTFSPDGEWVLLPWPQADQWLFIRIADQRVVAVADIARQLGADRLGPGSRVAGWF